MFQVRGQFDVRIDAKGRVSLPVRLRERLDAAGGPSLVFTFFDGGLQGFTAERWRKMERRFAGVSPFDKRSRAFLLAYVAGATEIQPDKGGRVLISPSLRRQAGLTGDCVLLSYLGTLEIWDAVRWEQRQAAAVAAVEELGGPEGLLAWDPEDQGEDL